MSKHVSLTLDDQFARFVEGQVAEGRYGSVSELVQAALRLLQDQDGQLAELRAALIEGEDSGPASPFDFDFFIAGKHGAELRTSARN